MFIKIKQFVDKVLSFNLGTLFKSEINNKFDTAINDSSLMKINKTNNTNNIIQQNFNISILQNTNVDDSIKNALSLGNKNAQLTSENLEKLFKDNNISTEHIQTKLSNPEFLYTIAKANEIAYLTSDADKRKVLSKLIYNKIITEDDMDSITLSQSITVMKNLTIKHLKLNALLYIVKSLYLDHFNSLKEFIDFYNKYLSKLTDIVSDTEIAKNKVADIGTAIIGNGCAVAYTFGDEFIEFLDKDVKKHIEELLKKENLSEEEMKQRSIIEKLNKIWGRSGLTSASPTLVGKCLAKTYLQDILNLDVEI